MECTVGIGENKLQAKIATGFGKPGGVFRITRESWFGVLGDRPTDALWGIGAKTARRLRGLGIGTVAELAATDPGALAAEVGPATGPWLVRLARGEDSSPVTDEPYVPRSAGRETTFQEDLREWADVRREVVRLAGRVAEDVAADGRDVARVIVKVRYAPFFTETHGRRLERPGTGRVLIEEAALDALEGFTSRRPVRLLGVRAEFVR